MLLLVDTVYKRQTNCFSSSHLVLWEAKVTEFHRIMLLIFVQIFYYNL